MILLALESVDPKEGKVDLKTLEENLFEKMKHSSELKSFVQMALQEDSTEKFLQKRRFPNADEKAITDSNLYFARNVCHVCNFKYDFDRPFADSNEDKISFQDLLQKMGNVLKE